MNAGERRRVRFSLFILALSAGLGFAVGIFLLDGYDRRVVVVFCIIVWLLANAGQVAMWPRTTKRPRKTEGV